MRNWLYYFILQKYSQQIYLLYIFDIDLYVGIVNKGKGKVFYGQEPPSGESTTTECVFNYQLFAVIYWISPMGSS